LKGWDLFKAILSNTSFYRKKLIFFILLAFVGASGVFLWQKYRNVEASVEFTPPESGYSSQVDVDVVVTQDAEVLIDGKKDNKALKFYQNFDEVKIIVFNSPGYFIQEFHGVIHLPTSDAQNVRQLIYAVHGVGSSQFYVLDSQTLFYEATDISPQAVVTIVADLPKGMVKPSLEQKLAFKMNELPFKFWLYIGIILPLVTIILMTFMILKRRLAQIIFSGQGLSEPPSKEPPAVVGVLVDGTVGAREISATLVDLARRGFISINNKGEKEFSFGKRKGGDFRSMAALTNFEKALLDKIFLLPAYKSTLDDVEMRIGRHIFSRKIAQFYLGVYNFATERGYFVRNPAKVHLVYKYTGICLLFLSLCGFALGVVTDADPKFGLIFWVGGMVASFFVIKLSPFMPARSPRGTAELKKWLAFRQYLVGRQSLSAKAVFQSKFEENLPLAMVLGAEVDWANRFMAEPFAKPEWYDSVERVVTLESFTGEFFPFIGYVAKNLARSHEPTVE